MSRVQQVTGTSVQDLSASFLRSLRAENKSPRTVETYGDAVRAFAAFLEDRGMPTTVDAVTREHVEAWIQDLLARRKPATAANRYRALQRFFGYAAEEGEVRANPMANMKPPKIPENPPDVLDDGQLRDLLKACEGPSFDERRDSAILMTFIDTGARLAEVAGLRVPDVDLDQLTLLLTQTKGRAPCHVGIGNRTARALDRYLRLRRGHAQAFLDELWLGTKGPLTASGIRQIARRRATQAGLEHLHPHQFRHTFAHQWLAEGGAERDLMRLTGWRSREMVNRYAASTATVPRPGGAPAAVAGGPAVSDVLVTARCRLHRERMGVLKERPNGVRHYGATNVGIYARNRKLLGPGDTTGWNFFEPSDYERDLDAWCRECGEEGRTFRGTELLVAVEGGRKSIFV